MPATDSAFELPRRVLLSGQVVEAMRRALAQGQWERVLPGERQLSEQYQVSRPTVRAALQVLAQEGWIVRVPGRRPRVATPPVAKATVSRPRKVLLVTRELPSRFAAVAYHGIHEAQARLAQRGVGCDLFVCRPSGGDAQLRKLEEHIRRHEIAGCMLATVPQRVQQWFAARELPTLVLGSCHPAVSLPSFDVAHASVGRHAAGVLLGKGHRRVAMLVPTEQGPGHEAGMTGFLEACEASRHRDVVPLIVRHDGSREHLTRRVNALLAKGDPPTGLVVTDPKYALMVMVQLLRRGVSIPEEMSLISRDQDTLFHDLNPALAHYAFDAAAYARRLSRLILRMVEGQSLPAKPSLIFPRYVPGGTVAARRS